MLEKDQKTTSQMKKKCDSLRERVTFLFKVTIFQLKPSVFMIKS